MSGRDPKNFLIIMADEHMASALGCAGHEIVQTPNLDRLAAGGTRFANGHTNNPICIPSRASFATGLHTHKIGYWDNVISYDGKVPGWGHRLQENGILNTSIGKLHYRDAEAPTGIDEQIIPMHVYGGGDLHGLIRDVPPTRYQSAKLAEQVGPGHSEFIEYDNNIAQQACDWLTTKGANGQDGPWVLFVSFICPHFPMIAPPEYYERYNPDNIPMPKTAPVRSGKMREWWDAFENCYIYDRYFEDDAHRRRAIAGYFGLISFIDDHVGRIVDTLSESGLEGHTNIAYVSDHGDNLGARGLWAKSTMYKESVGVPIILSGPQVPKGKVVNTPVSLIDFYPTILQSVGIQPNEADKIRKGDSLFDIASADDDRKRCVISEYHATASKSGVFMLRNQRYKYILYVDHGCELFDLENDPDELTDLSGDPTHRELLANFETQLRGTLNPEDVDARAKADQAAIVEELGGRDAVLGKDVPYATPAP